MGLNPGTFLFRLRSIITGFGFRKAIPGIGIGSLRDSDGTILTGATEPKRASLETTFEGVVSTAGQTDLGTLQFVIPGDYDATNDVLKVRFLAQSAGTDVPAIDATLYRKREGAAISSDLGPTISGAINTVTALADWVEIDCSGLSLLPGDAISMDFTLDAHASHDADIYGLEVIYSSDLVYYYSADRAG